MNKNIFSRFNYLATLLLICSFIISLSYSEMDAAPKKKKRSSKKYRSYNPSLTKKQALDMISSNSESLSNLVGIEAKLQSDSIMHEDGEILDDTENTKLESISQDQEGDYGEDLDELEAGDDIKIDVNEFNTLWLAYMSADDEESQTDSGIPKQDMMDNIMDWLGTPYLFGGNTRKAIDCSAFTRSVFLSSAEAEIPRTANEQYKIGKKVKRKDLKFGDLIFFHTRKYALASHVGIYLGDDLFAHASSRYGVTVSSLESSYYKAKFIGGRRYTYKDLERMSVNPEKVNTDVQ